MAKPTTYVFRIGDVDSGDGVYFSWLIDAASEEEAVRRSKEAMADSADGGGEPLYIETNGSPTPESDEDREKVHAGVLRVNPDRITAANIVESYEAYDRVGHESRGGGT
jgi:hypothetical protein